MNMSRHVSDMMKEYNQQMEEIIREKLNVASVRAAQIGELELYDLLSDVLSNSEGCALEQAMYNLNNKGYAIELEQPPLKFHTHDGLFRATLDMDKVKLKIRKVVMEI